MVIEIIHANKLKTDKKVDFTGPKKKKPHQHWQEKYLHYYI